MNNTTLQVVNQNKDKKIVQPQRQKQQKILCLYDSTDDDLYKIYFIESEYIEGKYYRIVATAFGAISCSCIKQTRNPYNTCKHMKILDEILEQSQDKIQKVKQIL